MKIATKLTIALTLLTLTLFSLYSYGMIEQAKDHLLQNAQEESINAHVLQRYAIHSMLLEHYMKYRDEREDYFRNQLEDMNNYQEKKEQKMTVFNKDKKAIYDTMQIPYTSVLPSFFDAEDENAYVFKEIDSQQYVFVYSTIQVGETALYLLTSYDLSSIFSFQQTQLHQAWGMMLLFGGCSLLLISFFVHKLVKPIQCLNQASSQIAKGSYELRTQIQSDDEIGELSQNFDQMAEAVERKIEELTTMVEHQKQFIADFSHEMKTPMTSIVGYADLLLHMELSSQDQEKAYRYIAKEGKRLDALAHALLELLMIEKKGMHKEKVSIESIVEGIKTRCTQEFPTIKLCISIEKGFVFVNEQLVECLLHNLITNAIKAKPKDTCVYVVGSVKADMYQVRVIDHGIGIPKDALIHIKEAFYMVDRSRARSDGGSGLGLALCDKIAKYHNTELDIESKVAEGTIVSFQVEVFHE